MGNIMLYCDTCAKMFDYHIQEQKTIKGECELCHQRLGGMNVLDLKFDDSPKVLLHEGGFLIRSISNFPVGLKTTDIEPTMPCKVIGKDVVIFFGTNKVILARPSMGTKIEISF